MSDEHIYVKRTDMEEYMIKNRLLVLTHEATKRIIDSSTFTYNELSIDEINEQIKYLEEICKTIKDKLV